MSSLITVLVFFLFINAGGAWYCEDLGKQIPESQSCNGKCSSSWQFVSPTNPSNCIDGHYCEDLGKGIPKSQSCNGKCQSGFQFVCPTNPSNCIHLSSSCDGRINSLCKESYCSGRIEDYPFYNVSSRRCVRNRNGNIRDFCGKRPGATYHNNQCFRYLSSDSLQYRCLNRMDISENIIRQTVIYKPEVDFRLNLFALFESNDTHIICDNDSFEKNCGEGLEGDLDKTISCKGREITKGKVCDARDFIEANNFYNIDYYDFDDEPDYNDDNCESYQFFCTKSRQCISKSQICDGIKHCEDGGEDEELEGCKRRKIFPSEATLPCYEFGRPEKYQVHINH